MNTNKNKTCLVYSFGLDNSIDWEARMASVFGCEVYGFDPTSKFNATPAPGVHFRKLGLKGVGSDEMMHCLQQPTLGIMIQSTQPFCIR